MLHTNNPTIKHKASLLNLAEELNNVSKTCKMIGISRDTFYRYQELVEEGGVEALVNRSPNLKNRIDATTEQAVIDYAIEFPAHNQHRTSNELRKKSIFISYRLRFIYFVKTGYPVTDFTPYEKIMT
ncbi:hypothetical protein AA106_19060 [Photorhabdus laumondii subsp. laumondii]|uniref:Photorhabdus luminescens subsp. laumondii TTO1 complete genome segment 3/17 n=1 Tax=Photorhabdus laumondii subsp. laumondii (strain DSM 15139 / CIP 105565 / TT01) TaxID=243265 RepID=Q7N886_PHOLL|nr:hypothetical protein A4R40_04250 [Photorhabdus laumondii subsp. laumondii]KTL62825.1 hypothetical protein AA106_19060 [Photorhabdus laumondii subsp. laumondii]CAE13146.1 unnamed protein product [Photorhabdus laumondii subsp. laumondii TTO1]